MNATRILARIIGPFMVIMGAMLILRAPALPLTIGPVVGKPELALILGVFTLIIGLTMIAFHNRWTGLAEIAVSLFAWATAIRGAALLLIPDAIRDLALGVADTPGVFVVAGVVFLALGAYFSFVGFAAKGQTP